MRKVVYARTQTHMTTCALTQSDWYGADLSVQQSLSCIRDRLISRGRSEWSNQTSLAFSGCFVLLWRSDCSCSSYDATSGDTFQKATRWRINLTSLEASTFTNLVSVTWESHISFIRLELTAASLLFRIRAACCVDDLMFVCNHTEPGGLQVSQGREAESHYINDWLMRLCCPERH